ncbi:MAG TPA: hypothetical protein VG735_16415 [Caulobacterales bacterium]|jgi:hypothetical protein|nr:hypothetical protein [Caulobacterales bacterium]
MFRLLSTLVLVAAVGAAAYFTRPGEVAMREGANAILSDPQNVSQGLQGLGATLTGDRVFADYYVGTTYAVNLGDKPVVQCWGAFTKVNCARKTTESAAPK